MTTARDLMTSPAEYLNASDTLDVAAQALKTSNVGSMPVRGDDGALCGVVTDRDLVIRGIAEGKDPNSTRVDEVCSGTVVSVGPDDDAAAVSKVFSDNQIRRVPVLDGDELVGIISQADLARELPNDQTGDVVQAISRN
ncbi:CBS domain-containing protein [Knoellia subterranea]|uniref:Histidine kinase n=1 Tax=Knoellia subterranea KCTC 19937 TaxID=1385521 RepID=A0A0A0JJ02_9MICO|nr:CBS domain-containing protein [Knoellia subterranea]KGN37400.1 histidine kinase [Knoellia subterranea KCTC 19937]